MKTIHIPEKRQNRQSLIEAKKAFLLKLEAILIKENNISGALSKIERLPTNLDEQKGVTKLYKSFGAQKWQNEDGKSFLDSFVYNVNVKHRRLINAQKIQTLIDNTTRELAVIQRLEEEKEEVNTFQTWCHQTH